MGIRLPGEEEKDIIDALIGGPEAVEEELMESIAKEQAAIRIRLERRRGHYVTIVEFSEDDAKKIDIKEIAKELKKRLAAGGTVKGHMIEVQGDHRTKVKRLLSEMGFRDENILIDQDVRQG